MVEGPGHQSVQTSRAVVAELILDQALAHDVGRGVGEGAVLADSPAVRRDCIHRNGAHPDELHELESSKAALDVLGLNFYPQWSTTQLYIDKRGRLAFRETEQEGEGFAELIRKYHDRYNTAIMITETSAVGSEEVRERWLESSLRTVKQMRGEGVPVIGYTWFPLFTMIDWRYRFSEAPLEEFYLELGLYRINRESASPRWLDTPIVDMYRRFAADPQNSVGDIAAPVNERAPAATA